MLCKNEGRGLIRIQNAGSCDLFRSEFDTINAGDRIYRIFVSPEPPAATAGAERASVSSLYGNVPPVHGENYVSGKGNKR
jgi:hypothetical protein